MNKSFILTLLTTSCLVAFAQNLPGQSATERIQRLTEIEQEARNFLAEENLTHAPQYTATEVNGKTILPVCSVPLKSKWAPPTQGLSQKSVEVICTRSRLWPEGWRVFVPVRKLSTQ